MPETAPLPPTPAPGTNPALEPLPLPTPAVRPGDSALFAAPTVILPASGGRFEDDEDELDDDFFAAEAAPAPPIEPEVAGAPAAITIPPASTEPGPSLAAPASPAEPTPQDPPAPMPPQGLEQSAEEHLFGTDADAAFFGADLGEVPAETAPLPAEPAPAVPEEPGAAPTDEAAPEDVPDSSAAAEPPTPDPAQLGLVPLAGAGGALDGGALSPDDSALLDMPTVEAPPPPLPALEPAAAAPVAPPPVLAAPPVTESFATPQAQPVVGGDEGWAEAAAALRRAADRASEPAASALRAEAARLLATRAGRPDEAREVFDALFTAGSLSGAALRDYNHLVASGGPTDRLRSVLTARAEAKEGRTAAELWQDLALLERSQAGTEASAVAALDASLSALGEQPGAAGWLSLRLLRDLQHRSSDWGALAATLERMAELATGAHKAALLRERGNLLAGRLDAGDEAVVAYRAALEASPGDLSTVRALEGQLRRAGEVGELVDLYADLAAASEGATAAFWAVRSARAAAELGDLDRAASGWSRALETAGPVATELRREHAAWLRATGQLEAVAPLLQAELAALGDDPQRAAVLHWTLGEALESTDADAALKEYQTAVSLDPSAGPAFEAAERVLTARGDAAGVLALLGARLEGVSDPNQVVTGRLRMAELCETQLSAPADAVPHYEAILQLAPSYLPALEGLERVFARTERWEALASLFEQRALLSEDDSERAAYLARAGGVCEGRAEDSERALGFYLQALSHLPDHETSLDAADRILSERGELDRLSELLMAAAEATADSTREVSLTYRAARLLSGSVGDPRRAREALARCLALSPGFLPALELQRRLAREAQDWAAVHQLEHQEADALEDPDQSRWRLIAATAAASRAGVDAEPLLGRLADPALADTVAEDVLEDRLLDAGDVLRRRALVQRRRMRAEGARATGLAVLEGELALLSGDTDAAAAAVAAVDPAGAQVALSTIAAAAGAWDTARTVLTGDAHAADRAVILESREADLEGSHSEWQAALVQSPLAAAEGLERTASAAGDREALRAVHEALAAHSTSPAVTGAHALLAGHLVEAAGDIEGARAHYARAFEAAPGEGKAFAALLRLADDAEPIQALFGALDDPDPRALAEALEGAGCHAEAADTYRSALAAVDDGDSASHLALLVRLERNLAAAGSWQDVFEVLSERAELVEGDVEAVATISARQRWVLAEHLAETDQAWDFYQQLHAQDPHNPEVLEALARIAGARGETELAVRYLEGLAEVSTDPVATARYQRRIAEAHLQVGDSASAQQAFHAALDVHPDDTESLTGLAELSRAAEDWNGLVAVLAREANVLEGEPRVARFREIAQLWEDRIGDTAVAQDAWRKVLEAAPGDTEALDRLIALSRASQDWPSFVEHGTARASQLEGAERNLLLSELGEVQLQKLYREDDALALFDAASTGEHPVMDAARHFERIQAGRGAWELAVEGVMRQARAAEGDEERVRLLLSAAATRLETLHDREGAAAIYDQILEIDSANTTALEFQGDHYYAKGDLENAVKVFALMEPAQSSRDLDDFDEQIEVGLYYYRFAEALRKLERTDDALDCYEKGLKLNRAHLPTLEAVGPLYYEQQRWEDARNVFRQILQLTGGQGDPARLARTYTRLGQVELELGNVDKAKKRFNKALELRSNDIPALQGIAGVLLARKDWNNLLNVYNNIIYHAQEPGEVVDAYLTKGFVLDARMSLPDKAAQHYRKSLNFDPRQPKALLRLAELALRQQDWPEASGLADRGLELEEIDGATRAGLQLVRYVAHAQGGDSPGAQAAYTAALEADPSLNDRLGPVPPGADTGHGVLRERLDAAL
jgi:tetratricopeptide (TPR) repeat protein